MYKFKRIMVGVDFSVMDSRVIRYAAYLTKLFRPDVVYFVHVASSFEVPDDVKDEFPDLKKPWDEALEEKLCKEVEENFHNIDGVESQVDILEGDPTEQLLKWDHLKDIDLLILGQKHIHEGSGILPRKLARKVTSSVLFVPNVDHFRLDRILVPIDFSENSMMAMEEALSIASNFEGECQVMPMNVFSVPGTYYKTGKSFDEFEEIMRSNAEKQYDQFMKKLDTQGVKTCPQFVLDKHGQAGKLIGYYAIEHNCDILIIGARGRTGISALLLGSITEKVLVEQLNVPLLIVKDKQKTFGFFEALRVI